MDAVIQKNTPKLRAVLRSFGYTPIFEQHLWNVKCKCLATQGDMFFACESVKGLPSDTVFAISEQEFINLLMDK